MTRSTVIVVLALAIFGMTEAALVQPPASVQRLKPIKRPKKTRIAMRPRPVMSLADDEDNSVQRASKPGMMADALQDDVSRQSVSRARESPTSSFADLLDSVQAWAQEDVSHVPIIWAGFYCSACVSVGMWLVRAYIAATGQLP